MNAAPQAEEQRRYRRRLLFASVQSFAHRTSAHGLGRFFAQQVPWLRALWFLVVMGALTGLTMHTYKQISLFLDYPVSSTTRLLTNRFTFPDVTFCDPLMKKFFTVEAKSLKHEDRALNDYFAVNYILGYNFADSHDDERSARVKAIKLAYSTFEHAVHTWRRFNMTAASARIFDMLIYCQYNQESCGSANFTVFYHRDYGNCFSFKASNRSIRSSGVEKGLILVLYSPSVDIKQSIDFYSDTVTTGLETGGLRVAVHQKDTIPYPSEYGINSPSGMQTVLALSQVQTSLANTPTKRCEPRGRFYTYDHLFDGDDTGRTRSYEKQLADCTTFENRKRVQDTCHCTIEGLVKTGENQRPNVEFCHDLLGAQHKPQLLQLLRRMGEYFSSSSELKEKGVYFRGRVSDKNFTRVAYETRLQVARQLLEEFPEVKRRLERLQCALESGRKRSKCWNMCKYTTYDFSVFQSRWPDPNFQIRGARIRLARIAGMLKRRVDQINNDTSRPKFFTENHALNYSITFHGVNLSQCLDEQLNRRSNSFANDSHCRMVHNIIKQSFLQLRVYPKTLTVRQLFEERSYELVNLFSDLGGIMGLWIGVSMVTLCEFAEITLVVVSYYVRAAATKAARLVAEGSASGKAAACGQAGPQRNSWQAEAHRYQQPKFLGRRADGHGVAGPWTELQSPLLGHSLPASCAREAADSCPSGCSDAAGCSPRPSDQSEVASSPSNQRRPAGSPANQRRSIETRL